MSFDHNLSKSLCHCAFQEIRLEDRLMFISIVICTYNRANKINKCLDSVLASLRHANPINAEIVIVNNNSKDNTIDVVSEWSKNSDFPVILVTEEKQGIAFARNRSFSEAQGDLVISLDDDCCLDINHIQNTISQYKNDTEPVLRFGQLELGTIEDWPMTVQTRPIVKRWKKNVDEYEYITMGDVCSANMAIPKEIINQVGIYDSRFGTKEIPGGEDADFGFRVYNAGYLLEYVPDMKALHFHGRRDAESVRKLVKGYAISAGALLAKHNIRHPRVLKALKPNKNLPIEPPHKYSSDPRTIQIRDFRKKNQKLLFWGILMFLRISILRKIKFYKV